MFERAMELLDPGESSLEAELRQLLDGLELELDAPPHGHRAASLEELEASTRAEALHARAEKIDQRVSEGAEQLRLAQAAHRDEARAAARRARALAALARSR